MDVLSGPARNAFLEWGVASRPMAGQPESGDLGLVLPFPGGILVAALDGLGHGDEAAAAARAAEAVLRAQPDASVIWLVRQCHQALGDTRGVVMSLASFSARYGTVTWIGVGNVEGVLVRADPTANPPRQTLLLRGGVVGFKLPELGAAVLPVARGDTLVFATDGVRSDFASRLAVTQPPQQVAEQILARDGKTTDDALALVAVFLGETA